MQSTPGALWVLSLLTAISISSLSGGFSSSVFTCCCGMLRIKASCTESLSPNRLPKCSELHERMSFLSVRSFEPSDERRGRGACVLVGESEHLSEGFIEFSGPLCVSIKLYSVSMFLLPVFLNVTQFSLQGCCMPVWFFLLNWLAVSIWIRGFGRRRTFLQWDIWISSWFSLNQSLFFRIEKPPTSTAVSWSVVFRSYQSACGSASWLYASEYII